MSRALLSLFLLFFIKVNITAQVPVVDLGQIAATAVEFSKHAAETAKILEQSQKAADAVSKSMDMVNKVNSHLNNISKIQEIAMVSKEYPKVLFAVKKLLQETVSFEGQRLYYPSEIQRINETLNKLLQGADKSRKDLKMIFTSGTLKMDDAGRMKAIKEVHSIVIVQYMSLVNFYYDLKDITAMRKERIAFPSPVYYLGNPANKYKINNW